MTNDAFIMLHSRRSQSKKSITDHRVQRIVTHADTNQISIRSAKKNMSHKHARMESKLVAQTPTGQNRHKDVFINLSHGLVTQTRHVTSRPSSRKSNLKREYRS